MLRAAYFAQELLSTFGTTIGEVALIPATGGFDGLVDNGLYDPDKPQRRYLHSRPDLQAYASAA